MSRAELQERAKLRESLIFGDSNTDTTLLAKQAQEAVDKMLEAYTLKTLKEYCSDLFQFIDRQSLEYYIRSFSDDCYRYGVRLLEKEEKVAVSSFTISFNDVELVHLQDVRGCFSTDSFKIVHEEKEYNGDCKSEAKKFLDAIVDDYIAFKGY